MTDDKDERCISAILQQYFQEAVLLNESHSFSKSNLYLLPTDLSIDGVKEHIETFPLEDSPEIFGLHANANMTYSITSVKQFIDTIMMIQPRSSGGAKGGMTLDEYIYKQIEDFEKKLPAPFKFDFTAEGASS